MKTVRVILVVIFMTAVGNAFLAQAVAPQSQESQQPAKEKIKKENLPAPAIKVLESEDYKGWTIVQAYKVKVKDAQGKETDVEYEVEVKKDAQVQALRFDKDGNMKRV